jgi:hypothetical protein
MYLGVHVKHPLFLSDFNKTSILSTDFKEMLKQKTSLQSIQWEPSRSMRMGGQTDREK